MTVKVLVKVVLVAIALFALSASPSAQVNQEQVLYVRFADTVINIPDTVDNGALETIKLPQHPAALVLANSNLLEIAHAFPPDFRKDSVVYNEFGEAVVRPNFTGSYRITMPDRASRDKLIGELQGLQDLVYAHAPIEYELDATTVNDPQFGLQWGLNNTGQFGGPPDVDIDAPEAWDFERGDSTIIIAVIDSGVFPGHEDLAPRVYGEQTGDMSHGTAVAGVASASTNNSMGIAGVQWNARIMSKLFFPADQDANALQIARAVDEGAAVLNTSWGGGPPDHDLHRALIYCYKMNRMEIASKGYGGGSDPHFPSDYEYAFSVGNLSRAGGRWPTSNWGNGIDVMAPGESIYTSFASSPSAYGYVTGTSLAAPHVTGLAALLKSHKSELYNDDIYWIIRYSATDITLFPASPGYDDQTGWGRIDAYKALSMLHSPYSMYHETHSGGSVYHIADWGTYPFYDIAGLPDGQKLARRYEVRANVVFSESFPDTVFAWGRGVTTRGFHPAIHFGQGWCGVVGGTLSATGCQLKTYVYELKNILGQTIGFFPCEPQNVRFDYTVLGITGNPGCCVGIRGNVNGDPDESIDIADMTYLINFMFKGGPPPPCVDEGNVNGTGGIDVADVTYLNTYMFKFGPPPQGCP